MAGIWLLTGSTFLLALYALIDQSALRRDLSAQVFRVIDGTATVASNIQRVILSPEKPSQAVLDTIPQGSVYIGATLQFATGHVMDQDPHGNLVLSSVTDGEKTRMATFSPEGAVGFGQIPLTREQAASQSLFLTGSPTDTVRDGWQSTGATVISDENGNEIGTISNVYNLDNPTQKGVQVYSQGASQAMTFSSTGQVSIGSVEKLRDSNTGASLLVGGDVVVDSSARTINYKCLDIQTFIPNSETPLLSVVSTTTQEFTSYYNGIEKRFANVGYFQKDYCYPAGDLPFLQALNSASLTADNTFVKALSNACASEKTKVSLSIYSDGNCTMTAGSQDIPLNNPFELSNSGMYYIFRCWLPSNYTAGVPDVLDRFKPT